MLINLNIDFKTLINWFYVFYKLTRCRTFYTELNQVIEVRVAYIGIICSNDKVKIVYYFTVYETCIEFKIE